MKKIRILQYVGGMNRAGAETMVMNLYKNIDSSKYEFDFACNSNEEYDYEQEIKSMGGRILRVQRAKLFSNTFAKEFEKMIDTYGPYDAIHSHVNLMNGVIMKNAKKLGIKTRISHSHSNKSLEKENLARKVYTSISRDLIHKYATCRLACSNEAGKYLYKNDKFEILNNSIDLSNFTKDKNKNNLKKELDISDDAKIITHVGRFIDVKNHKFIIEVFKNLVKNNENKNTHLLLCGDGILKNEIEQIVKNNSLDKYVHFLGVRNDINQILMQTDVCFMPSKVEGIPMALIEAQAAGCQCIISKNIPESVDLKIGLMNFMDLSEDIKLWCEKINYLKQKDKVEFDLIKKCIISNGYEINDNIKKIEKIYNSN